MSLGVLMAICASRYTLKTIVRLAWLLVIVCFCVRPVLAQEGGSPVQQVASDSETKNQVADYRLGAADKVRIIVFNEPTLSGEFSVGNSGVLAFPLIGDVNAMGRTVKEVTAEITQKLSDGYLRDPRVSLDVLTYRPFYILGEVSKPGEYPYSSGLTVMNAVARAEGYTYRANKKKVFIKRAGQSFELEVKMTPDLVINPGDTIRIAERYF